MKKKLVSIILALSVAVVSTMTSFAGWYYNKTLAYWTYMDDESLELAKNCWKWIDGNNDGIAECYCFNETGRLYVNTTTPDGYQVNENGAWIENGVVQIKEVERKKTSAELYEETRAKLTPEQQKEMDAYRDYIKYVVNRDLDILKPFRYYPTCWILDRCVSQVYMRGVSIENQ